MAYNNHKEHAFRSFHKDLKAGDQSPVMFMWGEEEYLIEWACKSLASKWVDEAMRAMDFVVLEETVTAEEILEACNTFSMLSPKRIIWAKNYEPLTKKTCKGFGEGDLAMLEEYIKEPNPQTILIFSAAEPQEGKLKTLLKKTKAYNFTKLERPELLAFAEKRFKEKGCDIDRSTLNYLIEETGYFHRETEYRIFNLIHDIEKIIAHSQGQVITTQDIDQTIKGDLDSFVFGFLDAVATNRKDLALRLLNNILGKGDQVYPVLGLLVSQFELMLDTKSIYEETGSRQKVVETLKMNEYRVKKTLAQGDKFSEKRLKEILCQLYEVDRNIKTGAMEQSLALELLVGRI